MPDTVGKRLMMFCGSANRELGGAIAAELGIDIGRAELSRFPNGEIYVRLIESVRGADVFVIQTMAQPVNDNFMELLVMLDALKRASARRITAVIPHYAYARQDKKTLPREPITAKLVADLLQRAGARRILTLDLHAGQIQGYFDIPVDHLTAMPILVDYIRTLNIPNLVVVSPDVGRVKTAKKFGDLLGADLAILHKTRIHHQETSASDKPGVVSNPPRVTDVVGDVEGMNVMLVDDMIDTAGTIMEGIAALTQHGAKDVYVVATHPVFSGPAFERLRSLPIKKLIVTDTLPLSPDHGLPTIEVLSIAPLIALAIKSIYDEISVGDVFKGENQ